MKDRLIGSLYCPFCGKERDSLSEDELKGIKWNSIRCECGKRIFLRASFYVKGVNAYTEYRQVYNKKELLDDYNVLVSVCLDKKDDMRQYPGRRKKLQEEVDQLVRVIGEFYEYIKILLHKHNELDLDYNYKLMQSMIDSCSDNDKVVNE